MKKNISYWIIISTIIILFNYNIGFSADALYRLMHNDHDALVIGEVISVSENEITIDVEKQIISSIDLNVYSPIKQIPMEETITIREIKGYNLFYQTNTVEEPQKGDYVLASVNKKRNHFINAWGIFKVDSKEYRTLNILYSEGSSKHIKMEAAAIKVFINSNGENNDFSFNYDKGEVYSNGKIIYEESLRTEENTIDDDIPVSISYDIEQNESKNNTILSYRKDVLLILMIAILLLGVIWVNIIKTKKKNS